MGVQEQDTAAETTEARGGRVTNAQLQTQLEESQAAIAALQVELEAARETAAAPGASADAGAKMVAALEALTDKIAAIPSGGPSVPKPQTFGRFEEASAVEASLENTVSRGEHSGKLLERAMTFRASAVIEFPHRGSNLNIVRKARHRFVDSSGETVVTPGVHYNFAPMGEFTTDDADVVAYLKRRPGFNREYVLVGEEPNRVPSAGPTLDRVNDAMIHLDVDALDEIQHEEERGHKREAVMEAVAAARRSLERTKALMDGDDA